MRWLRWFLLILLIPWRVSGQDTHPSIIPGKLVIKLDLQANQRISPYVIASRLQAKQVTPFKSQSSTIEASAKKTGSSVLDGIYILDLPHESAIISLCDSLKQLNGILYAEPIYQETLFHIPNDPQAQTGASQSYLEIISADEAWETTKGSENIIIGILDTGSDLIHEDLVDSYSLSTDVVNGLDDDDNGYIDDYYGFDFADYDNNPNADGNDHGTRVGGIAGATTNNGIGIAGIGYNSLIRPIKMFTTASTASMGSQLAIQYAADNNFDVINLSWGSVGSYSQFTQDVIAYAVLEKDVVVVAAAGNTSDDLTFYPAGYDYVLSVGATDNQDIKSSFSTFNHSVDLTAPGVSIYSTTNGSGYNVDNGTSYASPMVAGTAALVRSQYPELSAIQVMERIKGTTDPIYHLVGNQSYLGKLGTGRLNVNQAVNASVVVSMQSELTNMESPFSKIYFGDTVQLFFEVTNMLDPVYFAKAELISSSNHISILNGEADLGYMKAEETETIGPLQLLVHEDTPPDTKLELLLHLTDDDRYETWHAYDLFTASDYTTLESDSISLTIAADGDLGYATDGFLNGTGFKSSIQLANIMGFYFHYNDSLLLDNLPTDWASGVKENDFEAKTRIRPNRNRDGSIYTYSVFEDMNQTIRVEQTLLLWDSLPGQSMGMNYRIVNLSSDTLKGIQSGLMIDYDLVTRNLNQGRFDGNVTSYVNSENGISAGIRSVQSNRIHRIFPVDSLPEDVTDSLKIALLATDQDSIGFDTLQNVGLLAGTQTSSLPPGSFIEFQLALGSGDSLSALYQHLDLAETRIAQFKNNPPITETYISCEGGQIHLIPEPGHDFYFFSDVQGLDTLALNDSLSLSNIGQDTLIFIAKVDSLFTGPIRALKVMLIDQVANFNLPADSLFLGDYENNRIPITDASLQPVSWVWDFGNGSQATGIQNPLPVYNLAGSYDISLTVVNEQGCESTTTKTLTMLQRPTPPVFDQFGYCPGDALMISSADTLRYYAFANGIEPIEEGKSLTFSQLTGDTTIFLSRVIDGLESTKKEIPILANDISIDYSFEPIPDSLESNFAQFSLSNSHITTVSWLLDSLQSSEAPYPVFELLNDSIRLDITFITDSLCSVTFSDSVFIQTAPPPQVSDIEFCQGDSVLIAPSGGELYGYYTDSQLTQPISKGDQLWMKDVSEETTIYVTILDNGIPGEISEMTLSPYDYNIHIIASTDTLYLDQGRSINFSVDIPSQSVSWHIDNELETIALAPRLFFNEVGVHEVVAAGVHELGCLDTDTLEIYVFEELIIPLGLTDHLIIYPVPTGETLSIQTDKAITSIILSDASGKTYPFEWNHSGELDISNIPEGFFILEVLFEDGNRQQIKGIKQSGR